MKIKGLTIEDKDVLAPFLNKSDVGWENDFSTLFCWDVNNTMRIIREDGIVIFCNEYYGKTLFMRPFAADEERLKRAIDIIKDYADECGILQYRVRGLNEREASLFENAGFLISDSRDDYDYIYRTKDLKYLSGKAFHSKRNFVTRFEKNYSFTIKSYTDDDYFAVIKLIDAWMSENKDKSSGNEYKAILKALKYQSELGLAILLIVSDGRVVAISVTSRACNGTYHTLFEKADKSFDGIYQAVNKYAANAFFDDDSLVNRQEDLGIEGLRRAKLSYCPERLLKKLTAIKD